ncbi:MAG: polyhydroxyalkanoate synthesis regulator DNA-binding domain-containing protein [Desulfobacterales bacterium]|nr:polyhydroxyalkanoate synthesis regulator DNA-binding domain-containing protein [Desulfobacterales bacterium]
MRIIKTYANGRFYDTLDKKYLSKDQLVALIKKNQAFQIVMHKTGKDVTKSVLKPIGAVPPPSKASARHIDNLKKWLSGQVDRRVENAIQLINLPTKSQIKGLTADIETLAKQVDDLQNRLVKKNSPVAAPKKKAASMVGAQA